MIRTLALFCALSACRTSSLVEESAHDCGQARADLGPEADGGMLPCTVNLDCIGLNWKASGPATCETTPASVSAFFNSPEGPALLTLFRDGRRINVDLSTATDSVACPGTITRAGEVWTMTAASCLTGALTIP